MRCGVMSSGRLAGRLGGVVWVVGVMLGALLVGGCDRQHSGLWQGYLEGEYVQVASALGGRLERLQVMKGSRVQANAPLFELERALEESGRREAVERLHQAQARLSDLGKGLRPSELAAAQARVDQARSGAELASLEFERARVLHEKNVLNGEDFDRSRLTLESGRKRVSEAEAELATARLGAREDAVRAAEADVAAAQAAVARAEWNVAQKSQAAPAGGLIYDTLYREGEWVASGSPVVTLLPPGNIKVRFYVSELEVGGIKTGDKVRVRVDGRPQLVEALVTMVSPQAEYTPPVLYNRENRSKLVYLVEARPVSMEVARELHPGQPVDVQR